jgi:hypothetical protein
VKLPNYENAIVSETKITGYLLSIKHRDGRSKAEFFAQLGFMGDAWERLAKSLLQHAAENEVAKVEDSPFGKRYIVEVNFLDQAVKQLSFAQSGSSKQESISRGL